MKRNGFRRPERPERVPALLRPLERPPVYASAEGMAQAQPKGPALQSGKVAPSVIERLWMDWIVAHGCVCCRLDGEAPRPTAVHHILYGGQRMGHLYTLGLCDPGHHQNGAQDGLLSRHPWRARFVERYGAELQLLSLLRETYIQSKTGATLSTGEEFLLSNLEHLEHEKHIADAALR